MNETSSSEGRSRFKCALKNMRPEQFLLLHTQAYKVFTLSMRMKCSVFFSYFVFVMEHKLTNLQSNSQTTCNCTVEGYDWTI